MITWQTEFLDNLVWRWVLAFFITLGTVVIVYVIRRWILRYLRPKAIATATKFDDVAILVVRKTTFLFLLIVSILVGSLFLSLPAEATRIIRLFNLVAVSIQAAI